jgi:hypothetical protein
MWYCYRNGTQTKLHANMSTHVWYGREKHYHTTYELGEVYTK